jgi:hypothetical protein
MPNASTRRSHELTTICWACRGHRPSSHTIKRILAESPPRGDAHPCQRGFDA